jgi:hypothetical protein
MSLVADTPLPVNSPPSLDNNAPRSPFSGMNPAADASQDGRVTPVRDESQTVIGAAHGASR